MGRLESRLTRCGPKPQLAIILPLLFRRSVKDGWRLIHHLRHGECTGNVRRFDVG